MGKARNREGYNFSRAQRIERQDGVEGKCEGCGKEAHLEGHHIISVYIAARNPVLIPSLMRKIENLMMLCDECHEEADDDQRTWSRDEIGVVAWALFDLNAEEVSDAQWTAYPRKKGRKNKKKKKKKRKAYQTKKRKNGKRC